jgi:hypothetical protein
MRYACSSTYLRSSTSQSAPGLLVQQFHRHVRASKLISCTRTRLWRSQRRLFVYSDSTTRGGGVPGGLIDAACIFQRLMLTFVACQSCSVRGDHTHFTSRSLSRCRFDPSLPSPLSPLETTDLKRWWHVERMVRHLRVTRVTEHSVHTKVIMSAKAVYHR